MYAGVGLMLQFFSCNLLEFCLPTLHLQPLLVSDLFCLSVDKSFQHGCCLFLELRTCLNRTLVICVVSQRRAGMYVGYGITEKMLNVQIHACTCGRACFVGPDLYQI